VGIESGGVQSGRKRRGRNNIHRKPVDPNRPNVRKPVHAYSSIEP